MVRSARRILAITLRYPPYVGGGYELVTRDTVEELRARGDEVTVLAGRGERFAAETPPILGRLEPDLDPPPLERAGLNDAEPASAGASESGAPDLFRLSFEGSNLDRLRLHFFSPANYRATMKSLRETRPDLVLYFNLGLVSLAPLVAARQAGVPIVGFAGDAWPANHWIQAWREDERSARTKPWRLRALSGAWRSYAGLVGFGELCVPSEYLRRTLVSSGLSPESLTVVPHGIPPDLTREASRATPTARGEGEPLRIVCTSSLWRGKGQDVLVEAVRRLVREGVAVELVLAGGGEASFIEALRARSASPELREVVRFAGRLDRAHMSRLLESSHVLAMPSVWGEPFGLATLEGLAFGLCVIVSDAGASPELLVDGESGLVACAGDPAAWTRALARVASDEPLRRRLAQRGREHSARFTHRGFVDGLERLMERADGR